MKQRLSDKQRTDIVELYKEGFDVAEIAANYGVCTATVSNVAKAAGVALRRQRAKRTYPAAAAFQPAASVAQEIAELEARLKELKTKRNEQAIRFEKLDETSIVVRGVTEHFVALHGMSRLLEFITKNFPQHKFTLQEEDPK
jgi:IS30 family transposase